MTHCRMDTEGPNQTLQPTATPLRVQSFYDKTVLETGYVNSELTAGRVRA
jgi:hypothetical protein